MNLDEYIEQQRSTNPAFAKAWDDLEPEYSARRALLDARIAAGATQAEIAELLGVSQPAVARLESGRHDIKLTMLIRVAEATGAIFIVSADGVRVAATDAGETDHGAVAPRPKSSASRNRGLQSRMKQSA